MLCSMRRSVVAAMAVVPLMLSACGGDDGGDAAKSGRDDGGDAAKSGRTITSPAKEKDSQPAQKQAAANVSDVKSCLAQKGVEVTSGKSPNTGDSALPVGLPSSKIGGVAYWKSDHFAYLYIAVGDAGDAEDKVKAGWKGLGGDPKFIQRNGNVIAALDDKKTPTDSELAVLNSCAG